ncbi:RHS repeat-associated core domain-containing protein [Cellulomonas sp. ATA003]|uniref:RHS repeat-associated core domain-containing protein n=1 Tax=Cellulomonas sp. ATA003 TaxID=3073064 RepID=UPI002873C49C|nr:RHS repeat-associated core domain-containing protein [Cellulomonas sp. ATA003]WNB85781.1 RHS repeat-associated core domain-containing protein [Cellulomonas sp. ATA003]
MASVTTGGVTYDYTYAGIGNNELLRNETPNDLYTYTYGADSAVPGRPVIEQVTVDGKTAHLDNDPTGQPIMLRTSTGQPLLYIYDAQGSPVALVTSFDTTAFQYSFDPYGVAELDQTSGGNAIKQTPFLYTGGLHDRTTGWIKQGARYYDPTEGRWTQYDTLDAPLDPANANRYAYAANNPVNYTDPTGRVSASTVLGAAGLVVGAAAVFATGGLAVGLAAGSTALSVGSELAAGDTRGAVVAGAFGAVGTGFSVASNALGVGYRTSVAVSAGYSGLGIGAGLAEDG